MNSTNPDGTLRDYLIRQLNFALRKPGMAGGEIVIRVNCDALAFADSGDGSWREAERALQARGAFTATGTTGAFLRLLGVTSDDYMASVYAEVAHERGWLILDRAISGTEYDRIRGTISQWCTRDRSQADIVDEFGSPSAVLGRTRPHDTKTFVYGTARAEDPLVLFHLWNEGGIPEEGSAGPVLLAARRDGEGFAEGFVFTPSGIAHRAEPR